MNDYDNKIFLILSLWLLKRGFSVSSTTPRNRTRSGLHAVWEVSATIPPHLTNLDRVDLWSSFSAFVEGENRLLGTKLLPFDLTFSEDKQEITVSVAR